MRTPHSLTPSPSRGEGEPGLAAQEVLDDAVLRAEIPPDTRVLVAVSGGPDSVALLGTLRRLAGHGERRWSLRVGHVNHELRGAESDEDERFVRSLAAQLGLEVDVARVDTKLYAKQRRVTLEVAARELRARALGEMLDQWPGDVIATGHTQDDQAGTVLLRLLRGTGLGGLAGMRPRSGRIIRPFLGVRRDLILAALRLSGQTYRIDSSNLDMDFRRNRVREEVLPVLGQFQPRIVEVLSRTAGLLQVDYDYLLREAEAAISCLDVDRDGDEVSASMGPWRAVHPSLRRLTIRLLIERLLGDSTDLHEIHIAALCDAIESAQKPVLAGQLPHRLTLYLEGNRFALRRGLRPVPQPLAAARLKVPGSVDLEVGKLTVTLRTFLGEHEIEPLLTVCGPFNAVCDADRVGPTLAVRARQAGDRMRPVGAPGSRKLQDLMVDRHIPRPERDRLPVVESAGQIVWVPGLALDQRATVTPDTRRVLHLRFEPADWRSVLEFLSQVDL